ncbi:hypothetical protein ACFL0V_05705 [Nanoarchaeota archaeon]
MYRSLQRERVKLLRRIKNRKHHTLLHPVTNKFRFKSLYMLLETIRTGLPVLEEYRNHLTIARRKTRGLERDIHKSVRKIKQDPNIAEKQFQKIMLNLDTIPYILAELRHNPQAKVLQGKMIKATSILTNQTHYIKAHLKIFTNVIEKEAELKREIRRHVGSLELQLMLKSGSVKLLQPFELSTEHKFIGNIEYCIDQLKENMAAGTLLEDVPELLEEGKGLSKQVELDLRKIEYVAKRKGDAKERLKECRKLEKGIIRKILRLRAVSRKVSGELVKFKRYLSGVAGHIDHLHRETDDLISSHIDMYHTLRKRLDKEENDLFDMILLDTEVGTELEGYFHKIKEVSQRAEMNMKRMKESSAAIKRRAA